MSAQLKVGRCNACHCPVGVWWSDGAPLEPKALGEYTIMHPLNGEPPLILHACENDEGSEASPHIVFAELPSPQRPSAEHPT